MEVNNINESSLKLTSSAFSHNQKIPQQYTCDGQNINPPLTIKGVPAGTKSLTLLVDDPDAPLGVWDHWLVWSILPNVQEITQGSVPQGAIQGRNSFGENKYGGPCPPTGVSHRYVFKLYALDTTLNLAEGAAKKEVEQKMEGHIIGKTELIGLYQRNF